MVAEADKKGVAEAGKSWPKPGVGQMGLMTYLQKLHIYDPFQLCYNCATNTIGMVNLEIRWT